VLSSVLLRSLALAGMGQRQLERLAQQFSAGLGRALGSGRFTWSLSKSGTRLRNADPPVRVRRHLGWCVGVGHLECLTQIRHVLPRSKRAGRVVRNWAGPMSAGYFSATEARSGRMRALTPLAFIPTSD